MKETDDLQTLLMSVTVMSGMPITVMSGMKITVMSGMPITVMSDMSITVMSGIAIAVMIGRLITVTHMIFGMLLISLLCFTWWDSHCIIYS